MIKVIIFDLDGVLIDAKQFHYEALNKALPVEYRISIEEHLTIYDGLPTKTKLKLLTDQKGLKPEQHKAIIESKNIYFQEYLDALKPSQKLNDLFHHLKSDYKLYIASNSNWNTVETVVKNLNLYHYLSGYYGNQSVTNAKPNPEMYTKIMLQNGIGPAECLIVEDSPIGLEAAYRSGAHVLQVHSPDEVTYAKISLKICEIHQEYKPSIYHNANLNIVIPMAGNGSRFIEAGYNTPKPLLEIAGQPLIKIAVDSLRSKGKFYFLVKREELEKYRFLRDLYPNCKLIPVHSTEGAACTTLLAEKYINNDDPLLLANCDQYIDYDALRFFYSMQNSDGGILTFHAQENRWSYAKTQENFVVEVAEKQVISPHATCGIYYWKKGSDYVRYAQQMITNNRRVNNEFYICPAYNEAIADGKKIKIFPVKQMLGLGTPEDFEKNKLLVRR